MVLGIQRNPEIQGAIALHGLLVIQADLVIWGALVIQEALEGVVQEEIAGILDVQEVQQAQGFPQAFALAL